MGQLMYSVGVDEVLVTRAFVSNAICVDFSGILRRSRY